MKEIKLTEGYVTLVDDEDYDFLMQWEWQMRKNKRNFYAKRGFWKNGKMWEWSIHRLIMGNPPGMEIDHIDGNGLNNQKSNLRVATFHENRMNRKRNKNNSTGYKGVYIRIACKNGRKYVYIRAYIKINNKAINLGTYKTLKEAALAYDNAARFYFGQFASLNFKDI